LGFVSFLLQITCRRKGPFKAKVDRSFVLLNSSSLPAEIEIHPWTTPIIVVVRIVVIIVWISIRIPIGWVVVVVVTAVKWTVSISSVISTERIRSVNPKGNFLRICRRGWNGGRNY
jgi:hypothetical protein